MCQVTCESCKKLKLGSSMGAGGRVGRGAWIAAGAATGTCCTSCTEHIVFCSLWFVHFTQSARKTLPEEVQQQEAVEQPTEDQHGGLAYQPEDAWNEKWPLNRDGWPRGGSRLPWWSPDVPIPAPQELNWGFGINLSLPAQIYPQLVQIPVRSK